MQITDEKYDYLLRKRSEILAKLKPMCEVFGFDVDYQINRNCGQTETLVINATRIGCTGNSINAVVDEFIGYLFVKVYDKNRYIGAFRTQTLNQVKRYWINE